MIDSQNDAIVPDGRRITGLIKSFPDGDFGIARYYDSGTLNMTDLLIDSATGNVGIGTTSPSEQLHVLNHMQVGDPLNLWSSTADNRLIKFGDGEFASIGEYGGDDNLRIRGNPIYLTGLVGINKSNPGVALDVGGSIQYTGTITDVSDERLKENIKPIDGALSKIQAINGVYFNMIDRPEQIEIGVIAQTVQKVLPEAVRIVDDENGYLGVSYTSIIPVLIEAVKELKAENDELKDKFATLADKHEAIVDMFLAMSTTLPKEKLAKLDIQPVIIQ